MILYETSMPHVYSIYENVYIDEHLDGYTENGEKVDNYDLFRVIDIIDEDSHSRKAVVSGLKTKAEKDKPKFFTFKNADEYNRKFNALSTPKQQRQMIRKGKRMKAQFKKAGNMGSYKVLNNKAVQDQLVNGIGAAYNPSNNTVAINKNVVNPKDRLTRHKLLAHELRHREQFKAIKKKYGSSGKNVASSNGNVPISPKDDLTSEEGLKNTDKKMNKKYAKLPSEYDAFSAGGKTKSIRDRSQITGNKKQLGKVADVMVSKKKMKAFSKNHRVTDSMKQKNGTL